MKKLFTAFQAPSAHQLARREYEEAQRELLRDQTHLEAAQAKVRYHQDRIRRLSTYLGLDQGAKA